MALRWNIRPGLTAFSPTERWTGDAAFRCRFHRPTSTNISRQSNFESLRREAQTEASFSTLLVLSHSFFAWKSSSAKKERVVSSKNVRRKALFTERYDQAMSMPISHWTFCWSLGRIIAVRSERKCTMRITDETLKGRRTTHVLDAAMPNITSRSSGCSLPAFDDAICLQKRRLRRKQRSSLDGCRRLPPLQIPSCPSSALERKARPEWSG